MRTHQAMLPSLPFGDAMLTCRCLQDVNSLQYEAEQLATKAATEKAEVLGELDRLHKLVASFQAQIREVSGTQAASCIHEQHHA
jgi:hypothetical protein